MMHLLELTVFTLSLALIAGSISVIPVIYSSILDTCDATDDVNTEILTAVAAPVGLATIALSIIASMA